jgi:cytochrome c551/c552
MNTKKLLTGLAALLFTSWAWAVPPVEEGKAIFTSRCAACHNVNKALTGPALAGIDERRSLDWITRFIQSSQSLVKGGDKEAIAVFEQFNRVPMPDHPDLTADHIKSIVEYIKAESKPAGADKAPFAKPTRKETQYQPLSLSKDYLFFLVFLGAVAMLIAVLLFAVRLNAFNRKIPD